MEDFTHFNEDGRPHMVNVAEKPVTRRTAEACAEVLVNPNTFDLIKSGGIAKGDVLNVAQLAGIMGAKHTGELIPMCHPVVTDGTDLKIRLNEQRCSVEITARVNCTGRTGVEMEALTAASIAALTVYDMCKAAQRDMVITGVRLLSKTGGVHGDWHVQGPHAAFSLYVDCPRPDTEEWLKEMQRLPDSGFCGIYLTHCGVVRATPKAQVRENAGNMEEVAAMEFSFDKKAVEESLQIAAEADGVYAVRIWLGSGCLPVGAPLMQVTVGADTRLHAQECLFDLVGRLKNACVTEHEILRSDGSKC